MTVRSIKTTVLKQNKKAAFEKDKSSRAQNVQHESFLRPCLLAYIPHVISDTCTGHAHLGREILDEPRAEGTSIETQEQPQHQLREKGHGHIPPRDENQEHGTQSSQKQAADRHHEGPADAVANSTGNGEHPGHSKQQAEGVDPKGARDGGVHQFLHEDGNPHKRDIKSGSP